MTELIKISTNAGGIIFKKAELEKDFFRIYSKLFEKLFSLEEINLIEILGEEGG